MVLTLSEELFCLSLRVSFSIAKYSPGSISEPLSRSEVPRVGRSRRGRPLLSGILCLGAGLHRTLPLTRRLYLLGQ